MTARRLLSALGGAACVAAVIHRAIATALLSFDAALSEYRVEVPSTVPDEWCEAEAEWLLDDEDDQ